MASDDASTRFPFINLEKAIGRAQQIFAGDKSGKPMPVPTAFQLWGYSPKSSGGFQTVSALKMYGLLEDEGANADRRVKLTSTARRYFLDERDDVRNSMLAQFALTPALFKALWERDGWADGIPADTVARSHLKVERNLNDQSARALLSVLKETLHYAGIKAGVDAKEPLESTSDARANSPSAEIEKEPIMAQPQDMQAKEKGGAAPPMGGPPSKGILFDMVAIVHSGRIDNAEDLQEFINDLLKLKPLLPTKH